MCTRESWARTVCSRRNTMNTYTYIGTYIVILYEDYLVSVTTRHSDVGGTVPIF